MLSIRHSIGKTPLLEHMANDSKSVAHFPCYALAPPPGVYPHRKALLSLWMIWVNRGHRRGDQPCYNGAASGPDPQKERSPMAQWGSPLRSMPYAIAPYRSRAGLACLVLLLGWVLAVPSWATSAPGPVSAGRFRLWHDVEDILIWTWGGARTVFTLPTLTYLLPAAAVGGSSVADDEVQAHFQGQDEDDAVARAGRTYALLHYGPIQAGLYIAGEFTDDAPLSTTSKKAFASLLYGQSRAREKTGSEDLAAVIAIS